MNRIAELRTKAGLTQKEFGKQLNVGQTTVSSWENGKSEPSLDTLQKIAELLHTSVDEVLGKEAPTPLIYVSTRDDKQLSILTEIVADFMETLPPNEQIRIVYMLKLIYGGKFYTEEFGEGVPFKDDRSLSGVTNIKLRDVIEHLTDGDIDDFHETYLI